MEPAGTLERGLAVLRVLAAGPRRPMRATDLVRATGLARSTIDRIVATLVRLGYVRAEERDVLLAPRLMELGEAYLACGGLGAALDGYAERLADELDESVSLAVRDGDGVRFVGRFARRRTMSVAFRVGDLLPADRCAAGLILLDPAARWAEDDQLVEPGLVAVAVPVRDASGTTVCALTVASHTSRHTAAGLRDHALPSLLKTAGEMETALAEPVASGERVSPSHSAVSGERGRQSQPVVSAGRGSSLPVVVGVDASRATKEELGAGYLQSLARGLAVLVSLGSARGGVTLAVAAKVTGLPRATVRRAVQTLERLGYVTADGSRFVLLPKVLELGYAHLSGRSFGEIVQPHLVDLVARVHESASVAMLSGDDVVYVARVPTVAIMSVDITVGTRFPAYATSMGRVLLADLPGERLAGMPSPPLTPHTLTSPADLAAAVRQAAVDGYALVDQELEEGVRSIAVPIRDRSGQVVAAVNVATHASRATPAELLRDVLPALTEAAAHMEADLAHMRPS
ncbi:IclR family transcriptional regulator C-terminal domain-containing protein [Nonomuraea sp. NEAU-A123]|uniref:IclR family transcriptional regulator domain-containing protein n=1 Tax=Nonomuraea sp. NEAU-A123 TaxID=2839649 RepID=UPI001BE41423|nr:IclR family transcriptional regulator C-terminal domain-containing protein [Nonomuraea sp. NEAU-A123]MBT2229227.1 helix-turn-helix domain-containing protein [Nonomuraea sp. NEAU-A123]